MKLIEVYNQEGTNLSPEDLEIAYNAIAPEERTVSDLKGDVAREIIERGYSRNVGSAFFTLSRMHILIHGIAPHDMSERSAEGMFLPSRRMEDFVEQKGINVDQNIEKARSEIKNRPKKVKRAVATKMFSAYYFENKDFIDRAKFTGMNQANRESVIKMIMTGVSPEEAFAQF